ncbi:MAG TPA: CPBP family intramembrane glutamic endopeptidase [Gemmatimonadaceae bacterium]
MAAGVALAVLGVALPLARRVLSLDALAFWSMLAGLLVAHLVMLRAVDHQPWSVVGLARAQSAPSRLVIGLALGSLGILVPSGALLLAHCLRAEPAPHGAPWLHVAAGLAAFFLPQSLAEEMLARGYLFSSVRAAIGWPAALGITSVLFGLLHLANPGANARSIGIVMFAGVFLGGVRLATDSLYAAWMAHFAWNWSMAALLHTAVSGMSLAMPDYHVVATGPDWLTGGAWGPEGGAGAMVGMTAGLAVLVAWRRRARGILPHPQRIES